MDHPPDDNAEVKKLLKERHDELAMVADYMTTLVKRGSITVGPLVEAQHKALKAKLDLYEDTHERIAALRKFLKAVRWTDQVTERINKTGGAGGVRPDTAHQAKALCSKRGSRCYERSFR